MQDISPSSDSVCLISGDGLTYAATAAERHFFQCPNVDAALAAAQRACPAAAEGPAAVAPTRRDQAEEPVERLACDP
jgi:hypothetical protein